MNEFWFKRAGRLPWSKDSLVKQQHGKLVYGAMK